MSHTFANQVVCHNNPISDEQEGETRSSRHLAATKVTCGSGGGCGGCSGCGSSFGGLAAAEGQIGRAETTQRASI